MEPSTWPDVKRIFTAASGLSRGERASYVALACNGNDSLRREVQSLLEHEDGLEGLTDGWHSAISPDAIDLPMPSVLPDRIGDIRIISKLGEGASGVVYVGEQEQPKRRVAVKVLRDPLWGGLGAARLSVEAEALTRLRHPGIAGVLATGRDAAPPIGSGRAYIVLRLVDGVPITTFCREHELSLPDVVRLMVEVCDAVRHAHQQGVIHRDLKPANILVECGPLSPQPVVLDFGIARLTDTSRTNALTMTGQILGTPAYMSPEQTAGDPANVDQLSDVYSLGAIAYELLSGNPVHDLRGMDPLRGITAVRHGRIVPLGQAERACRGDLETVVMKALEPDKSRRYQSVSEFASDLRRFLSNETVLARPPTRRYKASMFVRRNKGIVATLTLVIVSLVTALVVTASALQATALANTAAQSTLRRLLRTFVEDPERFAGTAESRKAMLAAISEQFADFIEANRDDAGVMRDYALLVRCRGRIAVDEGDYQAAWPPREESELILRTLLEADPTNLDLNADYSVAVIEIGDNCNNLGDRDTARTLFERVFAMHRALVEAEPDNTKFLGLLCFSYERLAYLLMVIEGDFDARRDLTRAQLSTAERILVIDPLSRGGTIAARNAHLALAHDAQHRKLLTEAGHHFKAASDLGEKLLATSKDDKTAIIQLADALCYRAQLAGLLFEYAAAAEHLDQSEELAHRLLKLEPRSTEGRRLLANVEVTRALHCSRQDRVDDALRHATTAIEMWRAAAQARDNRGPLYGVACALMLYGEIVDRDGRTEAARAELAESLAILRDLSTRDHPDSTVIVTYAAALLDCVLHDLRDPAEALRFLEPLESSGKGVDPEVHDLASRARALIGDAK